MESKIWKSSVVVLLVPVCLVAKRVSFEVSIAHVHLPVDTNTCSDGMSSAENGVALQELSL